MSTFVGEGGVEVGDVDFVAHNGYEIRFDLNDKHPTSLLTSLSQSMSSNQGWFLMSFSSLAPMRLAGSFLSSE